MAAKGNVYTYSAFGLKAVTKERLVLEQCRLYLNTRNKAGVSHVFLITGREVAYRLRNGVHTHTKIMASISEAENDQGHL
jgi:hypothetical protein